MKQLVVSFLGAALLVVASTTGADPPTVPALNWFPCAPGADCAVAQVPLDYDEPQGAQTYVVLARYPAADQANHGVLRGNTRRATGSAPARLDS